MSARTAIPATWAFLLALVLPTGSAVAGATASSGATTAVALAERAAERAVAASAPVLTQPADMSVAELETADQALTASDLDGDPLSFGLVTGPAFVTVTTVSPGTGDATGNIHVAPNIGDIGIYNPRVEASDGILSDAKTFRLTVIAADVPDQPVLSPIDDFTLFELNTIVVSLFAVDADNEPLTFFLAQGPAFVSVTTLTPGAGEAEGWMTVAPGLGTAGIYTVEVAVSDGVYGDSDTSLIQVEPAPQVPAPPVIVPFPNITLDEGTTADQVVTATDANGDPVQFYYWYGPSFMTVTTTDPGAGTATGNIHLAPLSGQDGSYGAGIYVRDGTYYAYRSFQIFVNNVLRPPLPGEPQWRVLAPFVDPRTSSGIATAAGSVINGKLFVSHGDRFGYSSLLSIYDAASDSWLHGGPQAPDAYLARASLAGGTAFGRHYAIGGDPAPTAVEEFDPMAPAWYLRSPVPVGRTLMATASWRGKIYAAGGYDPLTGQFTDRFDVFDPAANSWTPLAPLPTLIREAPAMVAHQGKVYVFGGYDQSWPPSDATQIYDIATNTWTYGAPMRVGLYGPLAGVVQGLIAVVGGYGTGSYTDATEFYNPATNTWASGPDMPLKKTHMVQGATFDHNGIYAVGGFSNFGDGYRSNFALKALIQLSVPTWIESDEGQAIGFPIVASHLDGSPGAIALTASGLPTGATFSITGPGTGSLAWIPGFDQAGSHTLAFSAQDDAGLSNSAEVQIRIRNVNRPPVANAGGPYTGAAGFPVYFNAGGSSDPDGDPVQYHWVFGDGTTGTGPTPAHTYPAVGIYGVALTVSDGLATDLAVTSVEITGIFPARAFTATGNSTIRLGAGKPLWCVQIEPVAASFANAAVNLSSIVMRSEGTGSVSEISAVVGKTVVGSDRDANGVEEIAACFAKGDLRMLFGDLHGASTVLVTLEGTLYNGGLFRAQMDVTVVASGGQLAATVYPNPLNPDATLTFATSRSGPLRVTLHDAAGRLLRTLMDQTSSDPGYHDVRIDGTGAAGQRLPSGVYFYRIEAVEGEVTGRLAILK